MTRPDFLLIMTDQQRGDCEHAERIGRWRQRLIEELAGRPEGFTDGSDLIPGRPYAAVLNGRLRRLLGRNLGCMCMFL